MKKNIFLILMSLLFVMANDAHAEEGCVKESCCAVEKDFYAKIFFGANFLQDREASGNKYRYHTGYILSGSLGYCWCYGLCFEGEYAFRRNLVSKIDFFGQGSSHHGHFHTSSYMGNLLWNLPLSSWGCNCWNFQPFVGAGIGYDSQTLHSSNSRIVFHQHWNHFAWQLMAGISLPFYCNTDLTFEYKFHQGGCHFNNHSVGVGLVYKFCLGG